MFTTPLGLLALLGVPLVLALHVFRRRFVPREISALFLWQREDRSSPAGRRRQNLMRSPSLWCELIAALAIGLALGGPRSCGTHSAEHLVVVLDSSASMSAQTQTDSISDRARTLLAQRIEDLPPGSRVSLLATGPEPTVLSGPLAMPAEAIAALDQWHPALGTHDWNESLALAAELASQERYTLITDARPSMPLGPNLEWIAIGEALDNLGFVDVLRTPTEIHLVVQNFSNQPARADLRVFELDPATSRQRLEFARTSFDLQPLERRVHKLALPEDSPAIAARTALFRATLEPDALALDNEVVLVPPPLRRLELTSPFQPDIAKSLGLSTDASASAPHIDRLLELVPNSRAALISERADLTIAGQASPSPNTWSLVVSNAPGARKEFIGPFLLAAGDPIVAGLSLTGLVWSANPDIQLTGRPLISAGDLPLLTRSGNTLSLNLDPSRSTLMQTPDWPILLSNLAEERRRFLPGPERTNLRIGEDLSIRTLERRRLSLTPKLLLGPAAKDAKALSARSAVTSDWLLWATPQAPGLYALASALESPNIESASQATSETTWIAVNLLGGGESDLRHLQTSKTESEARNATTDTEPNWTLALLAGLGLLAVLLDGLFVSGQLRGRV